MSSTEIVLTEFVDKKLSIVGLDEYSFKGNLFGYDFPIIFTVIPPVLATKNETETSILNKVLDVKLSGSDEELKKIENYMKTEKQFQTQNIIPKISIDTIFKVSSLSAKTETAEISKQQQKPLSFEEALKIENINPSDYTDPDNSDEEFV